MKNLIVSISTLALVSGSATFAFAQTKDSQVARASVAKSCSAQSTSAKATKKPIVQNRCEFQGIDHVGVVPLVFGGAIIAGVVAIAVTNHHDDNNSTSP